MPITELGFAFVAFVRWLQAGQAMTQNQCYVVVFFFIFCAVGVVHSI